MADCFQDIFNRLTGHVPYRWQERLYQAHLSRGRDGLPSALDIPTGLGKTSVMAAWLAARHLGAGDLPRRLVYVVDRRAVVDQATAEADKLAKGWNELAGMPLAVSTLRGQHADNRAWLADPAAPAIIVGTVDMIGSRLLFEGYNLSRGMRPNQAGLLGVDSLMVLDESHLCPPFEALLREIETAAELRGAAPEAAALIRPLRLLSLSATGDAQSAAAETFRLEPQDERDPPVAERLHADKRLTVADMPDGGKPELALAETARALVEHVPARVLVFCHRRTLALKIREALEKGWPRGERPEIALLVGARRGWERERLAAQLDAGGWLGGGAYTPPDRPAFLVATSAGEVGVDLDADHMVCDLVPAERMIQRLGRVNRRGGDGRTARIRVLVLPADKKRKSSDDEADRLQAVREFLATLPAGAHGENEGSRIASPAALVAAKQAHPDLLARASTPKPLRPALTRALVDNWSLTSLREHPGRPRPGPWLRGWQDDERPQSTLLWRRWLPWHQGPGSKTEGPPDRAVVTEYFAAARPHPAEQLEIWTDEALTILIARAKAAALPDDAPAVLVLNRARDCEAHLTVGDLRDLNRNRWMPRLAGRLLVVSALLGGIDADGMLSGKAAGAPLPKPRAADQENAPENTAQAAVDG